MEDRLPPWSSRRRDISSSNIMIQTFVEKEIKWMFHRLICYKLRLHSVAFSSYLLDSLLLKTYLKGSAHPVFSPSSSLVSTQSHSLHFIRQGFGTSWWRRFIWNIDVIVILRTTEQPHTVVKSLSAKHRLLRQLLELTTRLFRSCPNFSREPPDLTLTTKCKQVGLNLNTSD